MTISELATLLWRRRWIAGGVGLLCAVGLLIGLLRQTPLYEAEASLEVDRGSKTVEFQNDGNQGPIEFSLLNTQRDMLLSSVVLRGALTATGADARLPYSESRDPLETLRKRLKVTTSRDSWVIQVAVRDEDQDGSAKLLQALIDAFMNQQSRLRDKRSEGALSFLSAQAATARERLEQARSAEQDFRSKHGIASTDDNNNQFIVRLSTLAAQGDELDRQLAETMASEQQMGAARGSSSDTDAVTAALMQIGTINVDPVVIEQQKQLYELYDQAILLAQKYKPLHPRTLEIQEQIRTKKEHLRAAVDTAAAAIAARRTTLALERSSLMDRVSGAEKDLNAYRSDLIQLAALSEERGTRERLTDELLTRLGQEEVASRLDSNQVVVVDPPEVAPDPANIRKGLFAAAAAVAGAVIAVATALIADGLDRRIRGALHATALSRLPVLVQIPHIDKLAPLGANGDPDAPPAIAEALRSLRATLRLARRAPGCQVFVITSTGASEGKSTVSSRLALSLASAGSRTVLIDADMRRPTAHQQLGLTNDRGLSFRLAGDREVTPLKTGYANLDLVPSGVRPPNPGELLSRPELGTLVAELRQQYDAVIIDTPPLGLVADALAAAELADHILIVVRDRRTVRGAFVRMLAQFGPLAPKILGIVFNDERAHEEGGYGYGYGYGYRYRYGDKPAPLPAETPAAAATGT